jgi:ATP-binding protein involved in chromosome partitioning
LKDDTQEQEADKTGAHEGDKDRLLRTRMDKVNHKIAVISGKGGVGKSLVTVNLAVALAMRGRIGKVGVLDADIHGPCVPKMLGLKGTQLQSGPPGIFPAIGPLNMRVVSMGFLLPSDDAPVIWRGPLKMGAIRQEVVKKAVTFARKMKVPIIGIVENMSGVVCPHCGERIDVFGSGGGEAVASDMGAPFLGSIPLDPRISTDMDAGTPFINAQPDTPAARAFRAIVEKIEGFTEKR